MVSPHFLIYFVSYYAGIRVFVDLIILYLFIDDLEPVADDADYEMQKRFNSALRIRVFKTDLLKQADGSEPVESAQ